MTRYSEVQPSKHELFRSEAMKYARKTTDEVSITL